MITVDSPVQYLRNFHYVFLENNDLEHQIHRAVSHHDITLHDPHGAVEDPGACRIIYYLDSSYAYSEYLMQLTVSSQM